MSLLFKVKLVRIHGMFEIKTARKVKVSRRIFNLMNLLKFIGVM